MDRTEISPGLAVIYYKYLWTSAGPNNRSAQKLPAKVVRLLKHKIVIQIDADGKLIRVDPSNLVRLERKV